VNTLDGWSSPAVEATENAGVEIGMTLQGVKMQVKNACYGNFKVYYGD